MPRTLLTTLFLLPMLAAAAAPQPGLLKDDFIYEEAPFPQCHASTICEVNGKLVAAWFGGKHERNKDVEIWVSRHDGAKWSPPVSVANGIEGRKRFPTWNPVLFQIEKNGPLTLFYKVGPSPDTWWGAKRMSSDGGATWSGDELLPDGILGPIKNKPVRLASGEIISGSSTEEDGWRVHFERSTDGGKTWQVIGPVADPKKLRPIQPALLLHPDGAVQALCRSQKGKIATTWSRDGGRTWSPLEPTTLPNPNSGLDAVTLRDGRHLVIYNHTPSGRSPLNVSASQDGKTWQAALEIETERGEFSYPAMIQTSDGLVHATYTWKRQRVKHVVIDPAKLQLRELTDGKWPK